MEEYSNEHLKELAESQLIYPEPYKVYNERLKEIINDNGWDYSKYKEYGGLVHESLFFHLSEMVSNLSKLLLNERNNRYDLVNKIKKEFECNTKNLFDEFYLNND